MKPRVWERAKQILPKARELPPDERAAYLDEACGGDEELRQEVESFLASDPGALEFMERPPIKILGEAVGGPGGSLEPESQLGAYRIRRQLGSGGMGIVYLATRVGDEFRRQVAIKVLQTGQASEAAEQRFLQEMGILAKLNHPNIAKLHEGGRTADGRLYYLMEHVEGKPIDEYCREHELSLEERLRLFQKVCGAIQYAHTQLVIHRDIKPSNVLVTADGEPKVLDFGVAKPLEGAGIGTTVLTGGDQKLFTPDYASPEQITGQDIHIASDVYSLGILLYELLAGDRPYRLKALAEQEMRRKVRDETPVPPSAAVARATRSEAPDDTTSTDPTTATFRRKLEGDLDTIALMALRKGPAERYATVQQLSDDIERHLVGLPIKARTPSLGYRARKFVRRNRIALGIAGLFFLVVGIASWALVEQYQETVRERDRAEFITTFVTELFRVADPGTQAGDQVTAREILDAAAAQLPDQFTQDPELRADLMDMVGRVYLQLGLPGSAQPLFEQALRVRLDRFGVDDPALAASYHQLGRLFRQTGDYDRATESLRAALRLQGKASPRDALEEAAIENNLGLVLMYSGRYDEAGRHLRAALEMRQQELGEEHVIVSESLNNNASLLDRQGRFQESLQLNLRALNILRKSVGTEHRAVAQSLGSIALDYRNLGQFRLAEERAREALDLRRRLHGPDHQEVARAHTNLGAVLLTEGRVSAARDEFLKAEVVAEKSFPDGHPLLLTIRNNLASALRATGAYTEAETLFRDVLMNDLETFGEKHEYPAGTKHNLATTLLMAGRLDEAEQYAREAMSTVLALFGPNHPKVLRARNTLGSIALGRGDIQEAYDLFSGALDGEKKLQGGEHREVSSSLAGVARCELARGDYAAAEEAAREALRVALIVSPEGSWRVADRKSLLGAVLAAKGESREAERLLLDAVQVLEESLTADSYYSKTARARLAGLRSTASPVQARD